MPCRLNSTEHEISGSEERPQPERAVGPDARLQAIVVRGVNGTVFDLSSAFRPDVANYGVAVPPSFGNGSLCLLPIQGKNMVELTWCVKSMSRLYECPVHGEKVWCGRIYASE